MKISRIIIATVALVLGFSIAAVFYMTYMREVLVKDVNYSRLLSERRKVLAKLAELKDNETVFYADVDRLSHQVNEAESMVPNSPETAGFLETVSKEAEQCHIVLTKFELQREQAALNYVKLPVQLTLSGKYADLVTFTEKLATWPRVLKIIKLKVTRLGNNDDAEVNAELLANIFYMQPQSLIKLRFGKSMEVKQ